MKNLGKVLRTTQTSGRKREDVLQDFLRVYRATPHTTTKVPPALLMMGQCRTSTLPFSTPFSLDAAHALAKENDHEAKLKMEAEYNKRMQAKGDLVLIKQEEGQVHSPLEHHTLPRHRRQGQHVDSRKQPTQNNSQLILFQKIFE